MSASLPLRMRLSVSVTGAQHKDADRRRVSVRGCASPAGLPPDVRGAPYPVKEVAPVAQARRDRSGRANRGRSSTQRVPASCALVPRRERSQRHRHDACLHVAAPGVAGYDQSKLIVPLREALVRWEKHVLACASPSQSSSGKVLVLA